jgi:hypothetical protein
LAEFGDDILSAIFVSARGGGPTLTLPYNAREAHSRSAKNIALKVALMLRWTFYAPIAMIAAIVLIYICWIIYDLLIGGDLPAAMFIAIIQTMYTLITPFCFIATGRMPAWAF